MDAYKKAMDFVAGCEWIDLTHTLQHGMPSHPSHPKFEQAVWPAPGDPARMNRLVLDEHMGTHVDSPSHFVQDPNNTMFIDIDQIPLERFMGHMVVLQMYGLPTGYQVTAADIQKWEADNIAIAEDDIVAFDFGQSAKWGIGEEGKAFLEDWPGLEGTAAEYLVGKKVKAVATDCVSMDSSASPLSELPAHFGLMPKGVLIYEMLNNLEKVGREAYFVSMPLLLKNCTGSPVRAVALKLGDS